MTAFAYVRETLVFGIAALLCRFALQRVETRWQVLTFWAIVSIYHIAIRPGRERAFSWPSLGADLIAVTAAIMAMKFALEGRVWP